MIFSLDFGAHTPKYGTQLRRKIPRTSTSNGTKLTPATIRRICKHEGCTNQVYVEGLCWTHGTLKRKHDDASVISDDNDKKEYFVHVSGLVDEINEDDDVTFDLQEGRKGLNAVNVKLA